MLATADRSNHYNEQTVYDSEWTESTPMGISWLSLLTAQPIPEEIDDDTSLCSPERNDSESDCSSSSVESCYVVLEIQRPRSTNETPVKVENDTEEEEETEEETEEINFAQAKYDDHDVNYEQIAVSLTTEVPAEEYAVEHREEQMMTIEEYANVFQPMVQETPNETLFRKAKTLGRLTKRIKAMSYVSAKEQTSSTSSEDEPINTTKLKTIRQVNEYYPTASSAVAAEPASITQCSNSSHHSMTSLDSIESKSLSPSPIQPRITTTFSDLSSNRTSNPIQIQRSGPTMGTMTLTRTFAFDRACMEKYGQSPEPEIQPYQLSTTERTISKETDAPIKTNTSTSIASPEDALHRRSFINTIPTPLHTHSESNTIDDTNFEHHSTVPPLLPATNSLSKATSILCLMKKYARTVTSEYRLAHNANVNAHAEPTLLEVKYLDGRLPLKDDRARESLRKSQTLSTSITSRLNRLGLQKMSSTQDLSSTPTTTFNTTYRKRMANRFRALVENNSIEPQPSSQALHWQHKTISELIQERRSKNNRHR